MVYPAKNTRIASLVPLDPALHTGVLNGMVNAEQAFQAIDNLSGVGEVLEFDFLTIWPTRILQGEFSRIFDTDLIGCGMLSTESAGVGRPADNNGDACELDFNLPSAGTWRLDMNASTDNDQGILKLYIDGAQIGVVAGYDLYAAVEDHVAFIRIAGLALTAGRHTLRFAIDGRNAASTAHIMRLQTVMLRRTA